MTTFLGVCATAPTVASARVSPRPQPIAPPGMFDHAYILPSMLMAMLVCGWFVTWGDWDLFRPEAFCGFYDAQARSFLHGRVDVPPEAIGFEAFIRDGKTYGYFGPTPALLRLPLVLMGAAMDGRLSRASMLLACAANLVTGYRIALRVRPKIGPLTSSERVFYSLFVLCVGIGSTNVFVMNRAYVYHEATLWGGAFAMLFAHAFIVYMRSPSARRLLLAGVFALLSLNARATAGAGTVLALCILAIALGWRWLATRNARGPVQTPLANAATAPSPTSSAGAHALIAVVMVIAIVGLYLSISFAKFHTFDGVPVKYYSLYVHDPARMAATGGRQIHVENIPTGIATYFGFRGVRLEATFPWVFMSQTPSLIGWPALDITGQFSSVPLSMPALTLLVLAGLAPMLRGRGAIELRILALSLLAGGAIVLATVGITQRYLHDFHPFLVVVGAIGAARLAHCGRPTQAGAALALLTAVSIALNCAFAIEDQRVVGWGMPREKVASFVHFQHSVDSLFHRRPLSAAGE